MTNCYGPARIRRWSTSTSTAPSRTPNTSGRRAAYLTDGHLEDSVDFASGIALCQAAGCVVTDLRGEPMHSGVGGLIAAADKQTHAAVLALVSRQFDAAETHSPGVAM